MINGNFTRAIPALGGAIFGAGVLGWGAGWVWEPSLASSAWQTSPNFSKGGAKDAPNSNLAMRPASPNATQVRSFQAQQNIEAQKDQEDRIHQQQLAGLMAQLQNQQSVPGPEATPQRP